MRPFPGFLLQHSDVGPQADPGTEGRLSALLVPNFFPAGGFSSGQTTRGMQGLEDCIPLKHKKEEESG